MMDNARMEALVELAGVNSLLGHPMRLKILGFMWERESAAWSELLESLESVVGQVNPNTVNFHILKLIEGGILEKGRDERYRIIGNARENTILKTTIDQLKQRGS